MAQQLPPAYLQILRISDEIREGDIKRQRAKEGQEEDLRSLVGIMKLCWGHEVAKKEGRFGPYHRVYSLYFLCCNQRCKSSHKLLGVRFPGVVRRETGTTRASRAAYLCNRCYLREEESSDSSSEDEDEDTSGSEEEAPAAVAAPAPAPAPAPVEREEEDELQ